MLTNFIIFATVIQLSEQANGGMFLKSIPNLRTIAATALTTSSVFFGANLFDCETNKLTVGSPANAAIAPLADVGLREYLVKDGRQWLRLALPTGSEMKLGERGNGDPIKTAQEDLELVRLRLEQVGFSNKAVWGGALKDANEADALIRKSQEALLKNTPAEASSMFDDKLLPSLKALEDALREQNYPLTTKLQEESAQLLADLRALQYPAGKLPYEIPQEYAALPRLNGRATVEMVVQSGGTGYRLSDGKTVVPSMKFVLEVDGYHAPLTGGNFVDLVSKKFYDGMPMQRVEELIVQTGKPSSGGTDGYVDPKTKNVRTIPLEIFYKKDTAPVYGITSDDDLRSTDALALPFQAYGALGMARLNEDVDSASSQVFFLKWNQALNPPGRNTLDGFYTCFGFVTENEDILKQVTLKDKIVTATVTRGLSNLVVP